MTIPIRIKKSSEQIVTKYAGEFLAPPATIHFDMWGGTGDFAPTSFDLTIERKTDERTRYALAVTALNESGNPMVAHYLHPFPTHPTNFGERFVNKITAIPDDVLEAVNAVSGDTLKSAVEQQRTVDEILGLAN